MVASCHFIHDYGVIIADERNEEDEMVFAMLIREIVDVLEDSSCFLCTTTAKECIWTKIKSDILHAGNNALDLNPIGAQITLAQAHR